MPEILVLDPYNFVPFTRTPWGGGRIPALKAASLGRPRAELPPKVGESWEVSTDPSFPSRIVGQGGSSLVQSLARDPGGLLGTRAARGGAHCPLLLKWLHAADVLSVQLHPRNGHPFLKETECGKPEAWLVLETEPRGHIYLGLRAGVGPVEAREAFLSGRPERVLFRYKPSPGEYVSIPPGLVHAVGPGVLLAEPQYVLPGKSGKTWRLCDWGRRYDAQGTLVPDGVPGGTQRELHVEEAFSAVDWKAPREAEAVATFVSDTARRPRQLGTERNPFALEVFARPGRHAYVPLIEEAFSLATCYAGRATFDAVGGETVVLRAGESAFVTARRRGSRPLAFTLEAGPNGGSRCGLAFFGLDEEKVDGIP